MAAKPSEEFHAFSSLVDDLLTVPKSALDTRMAHHRAKTAEDRVGNPTRAGRKPKEKTAEPVRKKRR